MKKKKDRIQLTEIFMAKAANDFSRCFHGTIKRDFDDDGNPVVYGNIKVNNGFILAMAKDQWELGDKLDELVLLVLDYGLNDIDGNNLVMYNISLFFN